jgi:hypothetical protein
MQKYLALVRRNYSEAEPRVMRFSELKALTLSFVHTVSNTRMPLIDFEDIFKFLFEDDQEFSPQDYLFLVDEALIEALKMQSMDFYDDGRTLANLLASQVFFEVSEHLPTYFKQYHDDFSKVAWRITEDMPRYCALSSKSTCILDYPRDSYENDYSLYVDAFSIKVYALKYAQFLTSLQDLIHIQSGFKLVSLDTTFA